MGVILKYKVYNKHRPADFMYFKTVNDIVASIHESKYIITKAIESKYNTPKGFYIEKVEDVQPTRKIHERREKILVFDSTGKLYEVFDNKKECCEAMNITCPCLNKLIESGDADKRGYTYDVN